LDKFFLLFSATDELSLDCEIVDELSFIIAFGVFLVGLIGFVVLAFILNLFLGFLTLGLLFSNRLTFSLSLFNLICSNSSFNSSVILIGNGVEDSCII